METYSPSDVPASELQKREAADISDDELPDRYDYGELILPHLDDISEEMFLGYWNGLEKDQQYDRLTQTLKKQKNLKYECMSEHLSYAKAFVEENKLNLLEHTDVQTCVYDVVHQNVMIRRLEDMRSFGYYLMKQDAQKVSPAHHNEFLDRAKKYYPFVDDRGFDEVLAMVFPGGQKKCEEGAKKKMKSISRCTIKFFRGTLLRSGTILS